MKRINHQDYLNELGKKLNLDLKFDEEGLCELVFNNNDVISIKSSEDDQTIILSTVVAEDLPENVSYAFVVDLIELALGPCITNGGNSPVVGRDPATGLLVLYEVVTNSVLLEKDLFSIFEHFTQLKLGFIEYIKTNNVIEKQDDVPLSNLTYKI